MKHGCYNTERLDMYQANDGYDPLGNMCRIWVHDTVTKECQYAKGVPDNPKCDECEKKGK